ncbi:hypothetical protein SAMN05216224_102740 [Thioclava dalianensis]|nr:hypothetical protein SAMN05216224_102740 [Thioclava dalianensis]
MRLMLILIWIAPACLSGCGETFFNTGPINDPLPAPRVEFPAAARQPCANPRALVSRGGEMADDAKAITRLGNALIECEARRGLALRSAEVARG